MDLTAGIVVLLFVITLFSSGSGGGGESVLPPPLEVSPQIQSAAVIDSSFAGTELLEPIPVIENYIKAKNKKLDSDTVSRIATGIVNFSRQFDLNAKLLTALIARESRFNPACVSPAGAQGLGQLIPSTAESLGVGDPFEIEDNLAGTARYFKSLLNRWQGNPDQISLSLASYLRGPGNISRSSGELDSQTVGYVNDILANYQNIH